MRTVVSEGDGEDDTTQVTASTNQSAKNTVGEGVNVRDKSKVSTVAGIHESCETSDQAEHGSFVVGVRKTDSKLKASHYNTAENDPHLLSPDGTSVLVDKIRHNTTERAEDNVEETEHCCPATGASLSELREVLQVVRANDGVDCEFTTERAGVWGSKSKSLEGEQDAETFLESRSNNDFTLSLVDSLSLSHLVGFSIKFLILDSWLSAGLLVNGSTGCVGWESDMTVGPFAVGAVLTSEQYAKSNCSDDDEWDDESHTPCDVSSKVLLLYERVKDSWHNEVSDSTTCVAEATSQGISSTDDILVKETGGPDLARDEGGTQDTDEESKDDETGRGGHCTSESGGNGTSEKAANEDIARTEFVAERTRDETNDEGAAKSHDVGVGVLILAHVEILLDGKGQ